MNLDTIKRNWIPITCSIVAFVANVPIAASALEAWAKGQPVDLHSVLRGVATAALTLGITYAKQNNNHSTQVEVRTATVKQDAVPSDKAI